MNRSLDPEDYQNVARPVSALAKDYAHQFVISDHTHIRDQLVYACSGAMQVKLNNEMWIVPPTRAVYIPSGLVHSVEMCSDVKMRTLYIQSNHFNGLPLRTTIFEVSELLRVLILSLLQEEINYDEDGRGGDIVRLIISELQNARTCDYYSVPISSNDRIKNICVKLLDDPGRKETLEEWSDYLNISSRTIARLFLKETGMGFSQWRQRVRLQKAMVALVTGEPVKSVAYKCGYSSVSAFTYSFRRYYGITPATVDNENN